MKARDIFYPCFSLLLIMQTQCAEHSLSDELILSSEDATTRALENKSFANMRVMNTLHVKNAFIEKQLVAGGSFQVKGAIVGDGSLSGPGSSTLGEVARFSDATGKKISNSLVVIDDGGAVIGVASLTAHNVIGFLDGTAQETLAVDCLDASVVAQGVLETEDATSENFYGKVVRRSADGSLVSTMITVTTMPQQPTDGVTKTYVDLVSSATFSVKKPARAASDVNIDTLSGVQTIDDVLCGVGSRILLLAQDDPLQNGLWEVQTPWVRPSDFDTGDLAQNAYVLVQQGELLGGTSWLCSTPDAYIDADPLAFILLPLQGATTGQNVGVGDGTFFKDKTGNYLHFKSLKQGSHLLVTNNLSGDDVTVSVTGYSESVPSTLVLRDAVGDIFAGTVNAQLQGVASENSLRFGDSMTGTFTLAQGTPGNPSLQFVNSIGTGLAVATANTLSFATAGVPRMSLSSTGTVTITQFTLPGVVHTDDTGALFSSLVVDNDIDSSTLIQDTKLGFIQTPGKVLDSATTATSDNEFDTIVRRNDDGNFEVEMLTASLINGALADYVLRSGDTMTGTFTLVAGSATQPSLSFNGSRGTGLSVEQENILVMSTDGVERLTLSATGTCTIHGPLVLAAGTVNEPSLSFVNDLQTGIVASEHYALSCVAGGNKRLTVSDNAVTVHTACVIGNTKQIIATQMIDLTEEGSFEVEVQNGISLLLVRYITGVPIYLAVTFPDDPKEGQLLTIKAILDGESNNLNLTYNYTFYPETEEVSLLNPYLALNNEFDEPYRATGGAAVTYIYHAISSGYPQDGWYRYARG